jgi:peroxiredoxin
MALLYTPKGELGAKMPSFNLPSLQGKMFSSEAIKKNPANLILFICGHCPYVQAIEDRLIDFGHYLSSKGVAMVAICSNDTTEYPDDHPDVLLKRYNEKKYPFHYLIDEDQSVAKNFDAVCTPDFFLYDGDGLLAYRGRMDDSWKDANKIQSEDLKAAVDAILKGDKPSAEQIPSMGCSIKWKGGATQ